MIRLLVLACAAAVTPFAMAQAQDGWTGTRLPSDQPGNVASAGSPPKDNQKHIVQPADVASETGRKTAVCVVSRAPQATEGLLHALTEEEWKRAFRKISAQLERCLGSSATDGYSLEMKFSQQTMIGFLAEAWLLRAGRDRLAALPPRADYAAAWTSKDASQKTVEEMAICLTERQPEHVADLLWSDTGSEQEIAATAALQPSIGPCLAANATLKTNRLGLRVALARAYFHRTIAPVAVAATR